MTPATRAREAVGLTLDQAAKQARICSSYLRSVERRGGASYPLALRLSRLYQCSANVFLIKGGETSPKEKQSGFRLKGGPKNEN
jgi:hypothetical protein